MENATKALMIAGGVLIAIIILAIGVYLYSLYSSQSREYSNIISSIEVEKFNSTFSIYIGRKDIKAQEIVTAVNKANEYDNIIQIYIGNTKLEFTTTPEDFIKTNQDALFSCTGSASNPQYDSSGRIIKLVFKKV